MFFDRSAGKTQRHIIIASKKLCSLRNMHEPFDTAKQKTSANINYAIVRRLFEIQNGDLKYFIYFHCNIFTIL